MCMMIVRTLRRAYSRTPADGAGIAAGERARRAPLGDHGQMGRKRKAEQHETFAEIVDAAVGANPEPGGQPIEFYQPIRSGAYTDESGVPWRMRRGEVTWKRIEHLIHNPGVRVLHAYMNDIHDVAPNHREDFMAMIRPYLKPGQDVPVSGGNTDFRAGEFKDDEHRSMLLVEETC
jgi:hypothetical protein